MARYIDADLVLERLSSYIEDFGRGERINKKLSQISVEDAMMAVIDTPTEGCNPAPCGTWLDIRRPQMVQHSQLAQDVASLGM